MIVGTLFMHPMALEFDSLLWLLAPLCASVAIIYKTVRIEHLRRLHLQVLWLLCYMLVGLVLLGAGLWAVHRYWPF